MSILDLCQYISEDTATTVQYLQSKHLLSSARDCSQCSIRMNLGRKTDISDGCIFRCPSCKTTKSLHDGSFFSKSKMTLQQWLLLLYWWVREYPVTDAAEEAKVGRNTAINVYQWLREVCTTNLLQTSIQLGGPGTIVQIDESLFRHKPKVYYTDLYKHIVLESHYNNYDTNKYKCLIIK